MPLHLVDKDFDIDVKGEIIEGSYFTTSKAETSTNDEDGDTETAETVKLGKVIKNHGNCGIAMIDIGKLDNLGGNTIYKMSGFRILMWQPEWLEIETGKRS